VGKDIRASFANSWQLQVIVNNEIFYGRVERPLIHQLGTRLWPNLRQRGYSLVENEWKSQFENDAKKLVAGIEGILTQQDLVLRYHEARGVNSIYGIVTNSQFVEIDQIWFRSKFLKEIKKHRCIQPLHPGEEKFPAGSPISNRETRPYEVFAFKEEEKELGQRMILFYGKNNGYSAFKVEWGRWILICKNGLSIFSGKECSWHHHRDVYITDFIDEIVRNGQKLHQETQEGIESRRTTELLPKQVFELAERLDVNKTSKQHFLERLDIEVRTQGHNEWALSQALTFLGSHERTISPNTRRYLCRVGTRILEGSLGRFLQQGSQFGFYSGGLKRLP
jgi:hypothetical protein